MDRKYNACHGLFSNHIAGSGGRRHAVMKTTTQQGHLLRMSYWRDCGVGSLWRLDFLIDAPDLLPENRSILRSINT